MTNKAKLNFKLKQMKTASKFNTLKGIKRELSKLDIKKYMSNDTTKIVSSHFYKGIKNEYKILICTKTDVNKSAYVHSLSYFDIQSVRYSDGFLYSTQACKNPQAIKMYIDYLKAKETQTTKAV